MDAPLLNVNVKTYLRFPLTLLKLFESLEPTVVIAVIAATAINAAIKPYSMAVAPFWSLENAQIHFICLVPCPFLSGQRTKIFAPSTHVSSITRGLLTAF